MKIAYCDCFSGISGDMFLGALLDAGLPLGELRRGLAGLPLEVPYELQVEETHKGALRATQFRVVLPEGRHGHSPGHHHDHDHGHHRGLAEITHLIEASGLPAAVQATALSMFRKLAEAEARVHGVPLETIHFHEVGAVDSIVDIVGAAIGLEALGITRLYASPIPLGSGQVETAHGSLPLPAPATLELLAAAGAPTYPRDTRKELVTPTGAAILAALATFEQPEMAVRQAAVGAGRRDLPWPNVLRLWIGEAGGLQASPLRLLETNIDDMSPEFYGHTLERLFAAGALDVWMTPIYMKKNRPAAMLSVLARPEQERELAGILLQETSTFGLRVQPVMRYEAERRMEQVETPYGPVPVKLKILNGRAVSVSPEYDACARLAHEHQAPLRAVFEAALQAGAALLSR